MQHTCPICLKRFANRKLLDSHKYYCTWCEGCKDYKDARHIPNCKYLPHPEATKESEDQSTLTEESQENPTLPEQSQDDPTLPEQSQDDPTLPEQSQDNPTLPAETEETKEVKEKPKIRCNYCGHFRLRDTMNRHMLRKHGIAGWKAREHPECMSMVSNI